jgi:RNA polymerase sigma-70 factor (ECF subfamily)
MTADRAVVRCPDMGEVDELVAQAVAAARAAWPGIAIDDAAFRETLRQAAGGDPAVLAELATVDLCLAQACAQSDPRAREIFDRDYLTCVPQLLARHPARAQADEVRQLVRERLLVSPGGGAPRIATYTGRGPLAGWVRIATLRVASNLHRAVRDHDDLPDGLTSAIAEVPELRVLEGAYRDAFRAAFRRAFDALDATERMILKLHHVDGVTVRRLAPILGVSVATAGRRILAAQHRLGALVIDQLAAAAAIPNTDVASVVRALISRLEISMSVLLG